MNWAQFKDPVSHICHAGTYTRGGWVAGSSPFTVMTKFLILNSANSLKIFRENSYGELLFALWGYLQFRKKHCCRDRYHCLGYCVMWDVECFEVLFYFCLLCLFVYNTVVVHHFLLVVMYFKTFNTIIYIKTHFAIDGCIMIVISYIFGMNVQLVFGGHSFFIWDHGYYKPLVPLAYLLSSGV